MKMFADRFKSSLSLITTKTTQLRFDLKAAKFSIREHCSKLRNEIDTKTETLISRIEEHRIKLFKEVEDYEKKTIHKFEKDFDKSKIEQVLAESSCFELSVDSEIDEIEFEKRINNHLQKLDEQDQGLSIAKFDNKLMSFESTIDIFLQKTISRLFGSLIFKPVVNESLNRVVNKKSVKFDFFEMNLLPYSQLCDSGSSENLKLNTDCTEFIKLQNGNFIHIQRFYRRNLRIGIFSRDFKKFFNSCQFIKLVYDTLPLPRVCSHDNKLIFCFDDHSGFTPKTLIWVLDQNLKKLNEKLIEGVYFKVLANSSHIFLFHQSKEFNGIIIEVYNWNLSFCFKLQSDELKSRLEINGIEIDDYNRLFVLYTDSIQVNEIKEDCIIKSYFVNLSFYNKSRFVTFKVFDKEKICLQDTTPRLVLIEISTGSILRGIDIDLDRDITSSKRTQSINILTINKENAVLLENGDKSYNNIDQNNARVYIYDFDNLLT